ncbi:uncharacterized protein YALI1_B03288g [Yarrowia lipolytica]|uniref:Uncharacterized protein n=1 Tax=Yarrowia lipolytica TaxID=4952 RepID=A0A1D8N648_YARLL|nr:hypothetical protein YALI1_B03288g [Yarrowia lipolytica]
MSAASVHSLSTCARAHLAYYWPVEEMGLRMILGDAIVISERHGTVDNRRGEVATRLHPLNFHKTLYVKTMMTHCDCSPL